MNTITTLLEKIDRAKELDFGDIISESIELFKKTWVQGLLLQVFTIIIMLPLIIIFYVPFIGLIIAQQESGYTDPNAFDDFFAGMSILYMLFVIVGVFVFSTVTYALNAGFFRMMKRLDYNESITTSDFFYFVKGKYLSKIFILMLIAFVIAIPSAMLCYIPLIYVMVPMSYFGIIFAFNPDLGTGDIVKASFKIGNKKWLISFGLFIVSYLCVAIITMITCGIGGLFLQTFMFHPIYLIYKKVVGFDETSAIEQIGTSAE